MDNFRVCLWLNRTSHFEQNPSRCPALPIQSSGFKCHLGFVLESKAGAGCHRNFVEGKFLLLDMERFLAKLA